MRRRVVITGAGCITPLGTEVEQVWGNLTAGRSGVGRITLFDASGFPVRIAAEVRGWNASEHGGLVQNWDQFARQTQFAVAAGLRAAQSAGLSRESSDPLRRGIYLGCGEIFPELMDLAEPIAAAMDRRLAFSQARFVRHYYSAPVIPRNEAYFEPSVAVNLLADLWNAQGPSANCISACTSSSQAIGEAAQLIRMGAADCMLAGGAHSMIHPLGISGFHRLSTLSTRNDEPQRAMRPFDLDRDGFVVGEGAAIVVLEELDCALGRGAEIWAELSGYGSAQDAFRITDPHSEGRGSASAIKGALADASLNPDRIDYINAHGSGTVANDSIETATIKRVFGPHAYRVPVSSTKSMTGHLTTAGGALEMLVCLMALRHQVVPPTINYETPDPECDLDYVPNTARDVPCRHVLNNSLGFGGQNVALIASRFDR